MTRAASRRYRSCRPTTARPCPASAADCVGRPPELQVPFRRDHHGCRGATVKVEGPSPCILRHTFLLINLKVLPFTRRRLRQPVRTGIETTGGRFSARLGRCRALPSRLPARPLALCAAKGKRVKEPRVIPSSAGGSPGCSRGGPANARCEAADRQPPALKFQLPPRVHPVRAARSRDPLGSVTAPPG